MCGLGRGGSKRKVFIFVFALPFFSGRILGVSISISIFTFLSSLGVEQHLPVKECVMFKSVLTKQYPTLRYGTKVPSIHLQSMPPLLNATYMQSLSTRKHCKELLSHLKQFAIVCDHSPKISRCRESVDHAPPLLSFISFIASKHCFIACPKEDLFNLPL